MFLEDSMPVFKYCIMLRGNVIVHANKEASMNRTGRLCILCAMIIILTVGCAYTTRRIPTSEVATIREAKELAVTTKNKLLYRLQGANIDYSDLGNPKLYGYQTKAWVTYADSQLITIPVSDIEKIEITYFNGTKTCLSAAGIGCLTLTGCCVVVAATKEYSCPIVYAYEGKDFVLEGEIYSGAIFQLIERKDFLKLHKLTATNGAYVLKISNEIRETQNTDELVLLAIDHDSAVEIIADNQGDIHSVSSPRSPLSAQDSRGNDILQYVARLDENLWTSEPADRNQDNPEDLRDAIILRYLKPPDAEKAKLVIHAGNTYWADLILGRQLALMGYAMSSWYEQADQSPEVKEKALQFMKNQGLCLNVSVLKNGNWVDQDYFYPTGPVARQDDILELSVGDITSDTVTIKLECGALFWMIDYAAVDYTPDTPVSVHVLTPVTAVDEKGLDITTSLTESDDVYYVMPEPGTHALVTFPIPELASSLKRSFIIRSEGYYTIHPISEETPDIEALTDIQQAPDGFLRYSLREFYRLVNYSQAGTKR